ncbi:hypothetical protein NN561_000193 [Cricetulus griseus]
MQDKAVKGEVGAGQEGTEESRSLLHWGGRLLSEWPPLFVPNYRAGTQVKQPPTGNPSRPTRVRQGGWRRTASSEKARRRWSRRRFRGGRLALATLEVRAGAGAGAGLLAPFLGRCTPAAAVPPAGLKCDSRQCRSRRLSFLSRALWASGTGRASRLSASRSSPRLGPPGSRGREGGAELGVPGAAILRPELRDPGSWGACLWRPV